MKELVEEDVGPESDRSEGRPFTWRSNAVLFCLTVVSVFYSGALYAGRIHEGDRLLAHLRAIPYGYAYAVPLLVILLTHEFGHYFAARYHRVAASLPYFIPLPILSPFGTMGAVISMPDRIRSRNALFDIGASGPLAGLAVALPVLVYGLMESPVLPIQPHTSQEGQSLLYMALKRIILGPIPDGYDVYLTPIAMAGWTGLFVTALNLIPIAQLDGGHIAYALFDRRQNRYARILHSGLLLMFAYNIVKFVGPLVLQRRTLGIEQALMNSVFWLVWFFLLRLLMRLGGRDHPPTEPGQLTPMRKVLAVVSLALFVLLFMPTPWARID